MTAVIILGIMATFFAWLEDTGKYKHGLKISFGLIFLFLALRYDYGNDYPVYLAAFGEINSYENINFSGNFRDMEIGWVFLCWLCKPIGFFGMTAILALLNCLVYYNFFKKFVPNKYYWFAVFLFIFNPVFMLVPCSAMRQNVAILLFVFSLNYLYKKKAIRYLLCIGLASLFHSSALILFPVYLLGGLNWTINKATVVIAFSIFVSLFMFGTFIMPYMNQFIGSYFEKYEIYKVDEGVVGTGLGILCLSALFILILYYGRFQNNENALIFKIAIISFIFLPLGMLIMLTARIGMYFQPALIAVYPITLTNIKSILLRNVMLSFLIFFSLYYFFTFFQSDIWQDAFYTYQTILSAPQWY